MASLCERLVLFIDILENNNLELLQSKLGIKYDNTEKLIEALTHNSFVNESKKEEINSNERLEYLGDAVLQLIVSELLFELQPNKSEGDMTIMRSHIVRKETLADAAKNLDLAKWLRVGNGLIVSEIESNKSILSNIFEALIGSIYVDLGYQSAKNFIVTTLKDKIISVQNNEVKKDPKSELQELLQSKKISKPNYVSKVVDPIKNIFACDLYVNNQLVSSSKADSKIQSEVLCAIDALTIYKQKG
ncbi:MAG: ribonuclease III [Dehalococcoidia bacterium]|nr:ribonuclease III [Dehalococcoidia bacterium]